jgi:tungstate transport system substrate-binding protein
MNRLRWVKAALMCAAPLTCTSAPPPLRLGTTYTVQQSGALDVLDSLWRGGRVTTVIGPSGQILQAAARGDLDVIITHAPSLEARILAGHVAARCPFVASRFAIVGPASDPAAVARATSAADALARIARARVRFVSRGDSSGTHIKELALWAAAGIRPRGASWYIESGADQTTTLQLADERGAYAIADLPTLARLPQLGVRTLFAADTLLRNPYTLYLVRPPIFHPAARTFIAWALGPWREALLARRLPDGSPAFERGASVCAEVG